MKKTLILIIISLLTLSGCQTNEVENPSDPKDQNSIELLEDPTFSNGFNLLGVSPVEDGRTVYKHLNYGDSVSSDDEPVWFMAQWWTPYDLLEGTYRKVDNVHIYETESRKISINPENDGYLRIDLSSKKEYGEEDRAPGESWTHALIEQNFKETVGMSELKSLIVTLDFTIHYVNNLHEEEAYDPNMHAAQFLWYLTLQNVVAEDSNPDEVGQRGDYLWFGIPIYDNRSDFIPQTAHIDQGAAGTTNKLIYSMSSSNYFDEKIQFRKQYQIEVDVLPYLKDAFLYALSNNALINAQFENMQIGYMNLGWELPGSFEVASTIQNISIRATKK